VTRCPGVCGDQGALFFGMEPLLVVQAVGGHRCSGAGMHVIAVEGLLAGRCRGRMGCPCMCLLCMPGVCQVCAAMCLWQAYRCVCKSVLMRAPGVVPNVCRYWVCSCVLQRRLGHAASATVAGTPRVVQCRHCWLLCRL
jgi:hypothetical protein